MPLYVALFVAAFLVGGIPTGYLVVKLCRKRDVRESGSGNIGFSNVLRTEGVGLGALVLFIDVAKAFAAVHFFASFFADEPLFRVLIGVTVILGNIGTPFLGFRGGKGVATALGVALVLNPVAAVCALACFLITMRVSHYMSVGSLVGAFIYAVAVYLVFRFADSDMYGLLFALVIFVVIVLRHLPNIKRLMHGQENRIRSGKQS
jgi:glycerol-3-phosphate acyltransferase PlsY